jgi:hypothetical protein
VEVFFVLYSDGCPGSEGRLRRPKVAMTMDIAIINAAAEEMGGSSEPLDFGNHSALLKASIDALNHRGRLCEGFPVTTEGANEFLRVADTHNVVDDARALVGKYLPTRPDLTLRPTR